MVALTLSVNDDNHDNSDQHVIIEESALVPLLRVAKSPKCPTSCTNCL